jgi:predicted GIY-YIG superfamily endonuclease
MQSLTISLEFLQALPCIPLEFRDALPETNGLYFAIALDYATPLLYVGKAKNLRERWKNHHRIKDLQLIAATGVSVNLAWLEFTASDEILCQQENLLVRKFRPPLNDLLNKDPNLSRLEKQVLELEDKLRQAEDKLKSLEEKEPIGLLPPAQNPSESPESLLERILAAFDEGKSDDWIAKNIFGATGGNSYYKAKDRIARIRVRWEGD